MKKALAALLVLSILLFASGCPIISSSSKDTTNISTTVEATSLDSSKNGTIGSVENASAEDTESESTGTSISIPIIPDNPLPEINIYGNTSGNLINGGLVAQQGNWLFYIDTNKDTGNTELCKMHLDGTNKTIVLNPCNANSINVIGDWVYCERQYGSQNYYNKVRTDGTGFDIPIEPANIRNLYVVGDWIYYMNVDDGLLYKMRTDGTEKSGICGDGIGDFCVVDDTIYYENYNLDGNCIIKSVRTDGTNEKILVDEKGSASSITISEGWIYYEKVEGTTLENIAVSLQAISTDGSNRKELLDNTTDFVSYNVSGDWIYCIDSNYSCFKIRTDGTEKTTIATDIATFPNFFAPLFVFGDWIYFYNLDAGSVNAALYKMRTDGTDKQKLS